MVLLLVEYYYTCNNSTKWLYTITQYTIYTLTSSIYVYWYGVIGLSLPPPPFFSPRRPKIMCRPHG